MGFSEHKHLASKIHVYWLCTWLLPDYAYGQKGKGEIAYTRTEMEYMYITRASSELLLLVFLTFYITV